MKGKAVIALVIMESDRVLHPLGVLYLGDALKKAGYDVRLFNVFPEDIPSAAREIAAIKPLFVGISTLTGLQTEKSYEITKAIKAIDKSIKIVWGGVHPSMLPEDCLKDEDIDIVSIGEGEELIVDLADSFLRGSALNNVKGIGHKSGGSNIINPARDFISNLDLYEPDWTLIDAEKCISALPDGRRQIDFITSRGCPHRCAFCYNQKFNKRRWRKHSYEYVIEKLGYLNKKHGVRAIQLHDDNFFVDMPRAFRILEKMQEMDIANTNCMIRLEALNTDILKKLRALGTRRIFVGWESGNDRVLKFINKDLTKDTILKQFELLADFPDIAVTAAGIIGFPTETWEEICETIDLGIKLAEMVPGTVVEYQTFLPYPGSHLYDIAIKSGYKVPENITGYGKFNVYGTDMDLAWLPWANKNTKEIFNRIDKYGKLLTHSKSSSPVRSCAKELLYRISKARLRSRHFAFPWEIWVLYNFNRYYNPKSPF